MRKKHSKGYSKRHQRKIDRDLYPRTAAGRYSIAATERALDLKSNKPTSFRRLPKELREAALASANSTTAGMAALNSFSIDHWPETAKKLLAAVPLYPESHWTKLPAPELLEIMEILRRRGPLPQARRIILAAECKARGMTQSQMALRLYPGLSKSKAYSRTRALFHSHRKLIEAYTSRLRQTPAPVTP